MRDRQRSTLVGADATAGARADTGPGSDSNLSAVPPSTRRYLLDTETLVFAVRRHPAVLVRPSLIALLPFALGVVLLFVGDTSEVIAVSGLVLMLAAMAWYAWKVGDWAVERFTVTDRRVLLISGLLTRRVAIMPLRKVTDLTFERSIGGRLLGFGAFVMESAGQHQALSRIDYLPHPEQLYGQMSDLLFGRRGSAMGAGDRGTGGSLSDTGDLPLTAYPPSRPLAESQRPAGQRDGRARPAAESGADRDGGRDVRAAVRAGSSQHQQVTVPLPEGTRSQNAPRRPRAPW